MNPYNPDVALPEIDVRNVMRDTIDAGVYSLSNILHFLGAFSYSEDDYQELVTHLQNIRDLARTPNYVEKDSLNNIHKILGYIYMNMDSISINSKYAKVIYNLLREISSDTDSRI